MRVTADAYHDAAGEHILAAQELWQAGRYVLAQYIAGLAVECMLIAYSVEARAVFDARHNLQDWYDKAQFADIVPANRLEEINAAMTTLVLH